MFSCGVFGELLYRIETNQIQSYLAQKAHMKIGSRLLPRTEFSRATLRKQRFFQEEIMSSIRFPCKKYLSCYEPNRKPPSPRRATTPPIRLAVPSPYAPPVPTRSRPLAIRSRRGRARCLAAGPPGSRRRAAWPCAPLVPRRGMVPLPLPRVRMTGRRALRGYGGRTETPPAKLSACATDHGAGAAARARMRGGF